MKTNKSILKILERKLKDKKLEITSIQKEILDDILEIELKNEILSKVNEYRKNYEPLTVVLEELEDLKKEFKEHNFTMLKSYQAQKEKK